jgi:hypothetical protein
MNVSTGGPEGLSQALVLRLVAEVFDLFSACLAAWKRVCEEEKGKKKY